MNQDTIDILNSLNASFYKTNSSSFDQTRQNAWPGWTRIAEHIMEAGFTSPFRMLDVACGNMRFEKHLSSSLPDIELQAVSVDSCDELVVPMRGCEYRHCDIISSLAQAEPLLNMWGYAFDAVVSFGFFHHVPSALLRARLLETLIDAAKPNGLIALSLWRFASNGPMRAKAERTTSEAMEVLHLPDGLESGDYLLGWNDLPGVYRYCHSFDDSEIESLISSAAASATLEDRFRADGHTGDSNEYLVFRKR